MKQTFFTITVLLLIVSLLSVVILGSKGKKTDTKVLVFFYGNTCPHCKDVEEWMENNKIKEKMEIIKKEVYDNNANAQELSLAAQSCGLDTNNIAVPFLYAENKCFIGTPDIVNYLSQKAGL